MTPWPGSRALMLPSLILASTQTSAFTFNSAKHGSSSVCCHPLSWLYFTLKSHIKTDVLYVHWQMIQHIFFRSDLTFCDWGHPFHYGDISEDEAAHRYCITGGGKQVSVDKSSVVAFKIKWCVWFFWIVHMTYNWEICSICLVFRAISHIMTTLFYPIITFFLLAICIAYWAVTAVYPSYCISLMSCFIQRSTGILLPL